MSNTYPCIKEYYFGDERIVVLFDYERSGTVLEATNSEAYAVGDYCQGWPESEFKLFGGTIELRND